MSLFNTSNVVRNLDFAEQQQTHNHHGVDQVSRTKDSTLEQPYDPARQPRRRPDRRPSRHELVPDEFAQSPPINSSDQNITPIGRRICQASARSPRIRPLSRPAPNTRGVVPRACGRRRSVRRLSGRGGRGRMAANGASYQSIDRDAMNDSGNGIRAVAFCSLLSIISSLQSPSHPSSLLKIKYCGLSTFPPRSLRTRGLNASSTYPRRR